jgi:exopolysaccharide biosynthesis polyprenyl glycosylphosphotransferase
MQRPSKANPEHQDSLRPNAPGYTAGQGKQGGLTAITAEAGAATHRRESPSQTVGEPTHEGLGAEDARAQLFGIGSEAKVATSQRAPRVSSLLERPPARKLARTFEARTWQRLRLAVDIVVLYVACGAAVLGDHQIGGSSASKWLGLTFPLVVLAMIHARPGPDARINGSMLDLAAHVLGVVSLATMLMIAVTSIFGEHPVGLSVRLWLFAAVYLGLSRSIMLWVRRAAMSEGEYAIRTLVVGAGAVGTRLVNRLAEDPSYGLRPVGFLDSDPLPLPEPIAGGPPTVPVLGGLQDLARAVAETGARRVILAFSSEPDAVLVAKVRECQQMGIDVSLVPRLFESINERATLDHVGGLPLITLRAVDPRGWQFAVKHALDRTLAALALALLSPFLLAIAIGVRVSSPGPILFRQQRVGRDGTTFTMLKFRSMRGSPASAGEADASWAASILVGSPEPSDLDPTQPPPEDRTTTVGRLLRAWSLDELPQLINVLRGDMSLVGPRPERVAYVRDFEQLVERYMDRHRVKSGVTGWAQVNGLRGETSIADRIEWDNYYIQNWSLSLDLRILALTLVEVFRSPDRRSRR